jgi:hypothetical protein
MRVERRGFEGADRGSQANLDGYPKAERDIRGMVEAGTVGVREREAEGLLKYYELKGAMLPFYHQVWQGESHYFQHGCGRWFAFPSDDPGGFPKDSGTGLQSSRGGSSS